MLHLFKITLVISLLINSAEENRLCRSESGHTLRPMTFVNSASWEAPLLFINGTLQPAQRFSSEKKRGQAIWNTLMMIQKDVLNLQAVEPPYYEQFRTNGFYFYLDHLSATTETDTTINLPSFHAFMLNFLGRPRWLYWPIFDDNGNIKRYVVADCFQTEDDKNFFGISKLKSLFKLLKGNEFEFAFVSKDEPLSGKDWASGIDNKYLYIYKNRIYTVVIEAVISIIKEQQLRQPGKTIRILDLYASYGNFIKQLQLKMTEVFSQAEISQVEFILIERDAIRVREAKKNLGKSCKIIKADIVKTARLITLTKKKVDIITAIGSGLNKQVGEYYEAGLLLKKMKDVLGPEGRLLITGFSASHLYSPDFAKAGFIVLNSALPQLFGLEGKHIDQFYILQNRSPKSSSSGSDEKILKSSDISIVLDTAVMPAKMLPSGSVRYYNYVGRDGTKDHVRRLSTEEIKNQGALLHCASCRGDDIFVTSFQASQEEGSYAVSALLGQKDLLFTEGCAFCIPIVLIEKNVNPAFRNFALIHHCEVIHNADTLSDFINLERGASRFREFYAIISCREKDIMGRKKLINLLNTNGGEALILVRPTLVSDYVDINKSYEVVANVAVRSSQIIVRLMEYNLQRGTAKIISPIERTAIEVEWREYFSVKNMKSIPVRYGGSIIINIDADSFKVDNRIFSLINRKLLKFWRIRKTLSAISAAA